MKHTLIFLTLLIHCMMNASQFHPLDNKRHQKILQKKKQKLCKEFLNNRTILKGEKYKNYKIYLNRLSGSQNLYEKGMDYHENASASAWMSPNFFHYPLFSISIHL